MILAAPHIRTAIWDLLEGAITYDGQAIKVYDQTGGEGEKYRIILGAYTESDQSNKHANNCVALQDVEVVAQQDKPVRRHVDAIGEQVMNILKPDQRTPFNLSDAGCTVFIKGKPSVNHLIEDAGDGRVYVRLILKYNLFITEN